ncbi:hypothetical protein Misp01_69710 [Microtetraspora sp. NBRC 13810]|uniref:hypothetical protein n=1 Tax=Microtetraspora sp. NBRC 13810 TaxID=3030990 RepID=UPI0024A53AB5|nr:hypothetical protein [Microtetraspora sp. NBRC 13810]GLW11843.1 hypothetical protein Misp01_69710 [Microtetraspora sp. NBRC 13810]
MPFRSIVLAACAVLFLGGCGAVGDLSGAVVRVQACQDAITATGRLADRMPDVRDNPAELKKALRTAADELDQAGAGAGDPTLGDALDGLADLYRSLDPAGGAETIRRASAGTAKYLQVITASCAAQ